MIRFVAMLITALLLPSFAAYAEPSPPRPRVGDTSEIRMEYETQELTDGESSGSSSGHTTISERVVGVRDDGFELEYDLPKEATVEERAREWQFPARVFRPTQGPPQLLNRAELEGRLDGWLKLGGLTREVCGKWYFTWNAFKIECDPQAVIASIEPYNLWIADLRDGAPYRDRGALEPAPLQRIAGTVPVSFVVELRVDPHTWRRERAEADVVVAEIMRKKLTLDEALRSRSAETVSGTITVTFDTDSAGQARRRTKVVKLAIKGPGGKVETQTRTERVERRLLPRAN